VQYHFRIFEKLHETGIEPEKAEEIFKKLQETGIEPAVYAYNALMEAYMSFLKVSSYVFLLYVKDDYYIYKDNQILFFNDTSLQLSIKNLLLFSNSRACFLYGGAEIFSLMRHMGCESDRASFNIMVEAYGRSGLHEGKKSY
ncbi:pentatricopeptide repeat-containing protein, partial [Tanacetum coccineum]